MNRDHTTGADLARRRAAERRRHRTALTILLALVGLLMIAWQPGARAVPPPPGLPGQPNGIPASTWSEQWRFEVGEICFEDWTGGFAADAISYQASRYTLSSDLVIYYRLDCEAAGFGEQQTITFVRNYTDCVTAGAKGQALTWTHGGYMVPNYLIARAVVHIMPNCAGAWGAGVDPQEAAENKRMVIGHEIGHIFGFKHVEIPMCDPASLGSWSCRPDTVMAGQAGVNVTLTTWDYWRLDTIHPW